MGDRRGPDTETDFLAKILRAPRSESSSSSSLDSSSFSAFSETSSATTNLGGGGSTVATRWAKIKAKFPEVTKPSNLGEAVERRYTLSKLVSQKLKLRYLTSQTQLVILRGHVHFLEAKARNDLSDRVDLIKRRVEEGSEKRVRMIVDAILFSFLDQAKTNVSVRGKSFDYLVGDKFIIETKTKATLGTGLGAFCQLLDYMLEFKCVIGFVTDGEVWHAYFLLEKEKKLLHLEQTLDPVDIAEILYRVITQPDMLYYRIDHITKFFL